MTGDAASAWTMNPALLATHPTDRLAVSHLQWANGLAQEWLAIECGARHARIGFAADILHAPELPGYDDSGNPAESIRASEWNGSAGLALAITGELDLGLTTHIHRQTQANAALGGVGLGLGLAFHRSSWTAGIAAGEFGSVSGDNADLYALPSNWTLGVERALGSRATVAVSAERESAGEWAVRCGTVLRPHPSFELAAGGASAITALGTSIDWSAGLRMAVGRVHAAYAFHPAGELGSTHQVGLELPLGGSSSLWQGIPDASGSAPR